MSETETEESSGTPWYMYILYFSGAIIFILIILGMIAGAN